ncbi:MAG TPA: glutamate 5-kinase [Spirochaetes bacterium]|nr:glutamate 5-kinase [Spirochaetota bacterium]
MTDRKAFFSKMNRVVLKIGTNLLSEQGEISILKFKKVVQEIVSLKGYVKDLVVVTSGAIGAGCTQILKKNKPMTIPLKQASASIGQVIIMKHYMELLAEHDLLVSQILLTDGVLKDRDRYVNAKNTLTTLFQYNVIPIVNENDTVAVDEIKFGENDTLAALVTSLVDADLLILLSDVDGFYLHYNEPDKRERMSEITEITSEIEEEAKSPGSLFSTGGMKSKLKAAKVTSHHGIPLVIANGNKGGIIQKLFDGENEGTLFLPSKVELSKNRKRWIHLNSRAKGKLYIDDNAVKALVEGNKSLLPKGIIRVEGTFHNYDTVEIVDPAGQIVAKGITNYNHQEVSKILGAHSSDIEKILGYRYYDFVVRNDNLVILKN